MKNNSMKSRPITSRSKGTPLHKDENEEDPKKLGKMDVVDAQGNLLGADDNVTSGSPGKPAETKIVVEDYSKNWDKEAAGGLSYDQWIKVPGNKKKEQEFVDSKTKTITTDATDGTSGQRTTSYEPKLTEGKEADKVDTFLPWERRFAQRTQRGAVRDEIKRGKKGMKQLDKALKAGAITQEQYDTDYANAQKLAFGQGTIAKGQYTDTEGMDAILSQGYQANPAVTTQTDMLRKPQGEQQGGQPVKADGTEQMTKEDYEAGGKGKSTPKTSKAVQDASSNAGASVTEDQAKQESGESTNLSTADPSVDQKFPYQYKHINKIKKYKDIPEIGEPKGAELVQINKPDTRPSSSDMFGGLSTVELADLSEALTDQQNQATNEANEFTGESVQANTGTGNRSNMVSFEPTAREKAEKTIEAPGSDLPKINESYVENTEDVISAEADAMLTEDMKNSRSAFKMRRTHNSRTMYGESPAKMWGPSKKASAGKTTGAQNIDSSTPGRPVTQNVTRSAKGIVTGKLNQSSGFKMKGFGNGKK